MSDKTHVEHNESALALITRHSRGHGFPLQWGPKPTYAVQQSQRLLDDLVGEREQLVRHTQAERLRGLEIDDKLELGGPLDASNEKAPAFNRGLQQRAYIRPRRLVISFYLRTPGLNSELPAVASLDVRGDRRTGGFSLTTRHLGALARPQRRRR
jgi:hypothetical protein